MNLRPSKRYKPAFSMLPPAGARVLDVGSGSGHDAAALAARGYRVIGIEPSLGLRGEAIRRHKSSSILWLNDVLPKLASVRGQSFALILVSAVWMHIAPRNRLPAMRRLAELLDSGGRLISLRMDPDDPDRAITYVDVPSVVSDASKAGLTLMRRMDSEDALGRCDVRWLMLALARG